jgi:hypothetical protein
LAVVIVALTMVILPLGVFALHQFGDVPDSNTYHNDIDAIADAGVTTGCGGGNYCPSAFVTREQMAAFMNRLGALGPGKVPVVNADKVDGFNGTDLAFGTATIPSGMTVTGFYYWDAGTTLDNGDVQFALELPGLAPVALGTDSVNFAPSAYSQDDDATCSGSAAAPTAPSGRFCIYIYAAANVEGAEGFGAPSPFEYRYGRVLFFTNSPTLGDDMYLHLSWAYTAP